VTTTYKPGRVPDDPRLIAKFLRSELAAIKRAMEAPESVTRHQVLHAEPAKSFEGDEIEVDGVDFNPGHGPGTYVRRNGAWTRGDITGASGTFSGNLDVAGTARFRGSYTGSLGPASVYANEDQAATIGVVSFSGPSGYAYYGYATGASHAVVGVATGSGTGAVGTSSTGHGVSGESGGASGAGVRGNNTSTGPSVECVTKFKWGGYTWSVPDGTTKILRADGTWSAAYVKGDYTAGNSSGNVPVSNGTLNTNLNAQYLNGNASTAFLGASATAADSTQLGGYGVGNWLRVTGSGAGSPGAADAYIQVTNGSVTVKLLCVLVP
jgi:hypothetical protein